MRKQIKWITGLKGIACIMVMVCHYFNIYRLAVEPTGVFTDMPKWIVDLCASDYLYFFIASFWLYLFFIISGYLLGISHIKSIYQLIKKSALRFLRFALPILFAYAVIYGIYQYLGFHNFETTDLFTNSWFQTEFYTLSYTIDDVINSPIEVLVHGKALLNVPYWVLREMFQTSILIYIVDYLRDSKWFNSIYPVIYLGFIYYALMIIKSDVMVACLLGAGAAYAEEQIKNPTKMQLILLGSIIVIMLLPTLTTNQLHAISFFILILIIPYIPWLDHLLSFKIIEFLGKISWGVYSFHWPIFCSIGATYILEHATQINLVDSYFQASLMCAGITIVVSIIFYFTLEKLANWIIQTINKGLCKVENLFMKKEVGFNQ